jgi:hypothetical protein
MDRSIGIAGALGTWRAFGRIDADAVILFGIGRGGTVCGDAAIAAAGDEGVAQEAYEQVHCIEGGLLRTRPCFTRDLRQACRRQRTEHQRDATGGVEGIGQRVGEVALIEVEGPKGRKRRRNEVQRQVEISVGRIVVQAGREIRGQVGVDQRTERAADVACGEDGILLRDITAVGIGRVDGGATERRRPRDIGG